MNIRTDSWHFRLIKWMLSEELYNYWHYSHGGPFGDTHVKEGYRINLCQYMGLFFKSAVLFLLVGALISVVAGIIGYLLYHKPVFVLGIIVGATLGFGIIKGISKLQKAFDIFRGYRYAEEGSFMALVLEYRRALKNKFCVNLNIVEPEVTPVEAVQEAITALDKLSDKKP